MIPILKCPRNVVRSLNGISRNGMSTNQTLPSHARVVICGGGVVGTSLLYHLVNKGIKDVVLLERGKLTCGTTWLAAGCVGVFRNTRTESLLSRYSATLYEKLQTSGHDIEFRKCGSINLAKTADRLHTFQRSETPNSTRGIECAILSPEDCKKKFPLIAVSDIFGGLWIQDDCIVNPRRVVEVLAEQAQKGGGRIIEECIVEEVTTEPVPPARCKVKSVKTSMGQISCDVFVNCSGQWAREVGKRTKPLVRVPVHPCEHSVIITESIGLAPSLPILRDYDGSIYLREWKGGILAGGFEPLAKPVYFSGIPADFKFTRLPEDWDHFQILLKNLIHRVPKAGDAVAVELINAPEAFTPDAKIMLGEASEVKNYFIAAGMNGSGVSLAGGVGKVVAEWIVDGKSEINLWQVDMRRFVGLHSNRHFLRDRVRETVGKQFTLKYPNYGMSAYTTGRKLRTSCLHTRLESAGAVFGEQLGFERALWFDPNSKDTFVEDNVIYGSFGKPFWFNLVKDEYTSCRQGVAVIDMSSFTKIDIKSGGDEALKFLQRLCSNDIDRPVGEVIHTGMHNAIGGYENDCSIVRVEENHFLMICPTSQQTRCKMWLKQHLPPDGSVLFSDVTSLFTAINVVGPHAPQLLQEMTETPLAKTDFPSMTCQSVNIGYASEILAMRLTHTGEDGFVLYCPSEYALHVYDKLMSVGRNYGIRNAGYYAMRTLRIEKFFAFWGQDIDSMATPFECGRDYRVKFDKGDFIGKEALLKQKEVGVQRRFVQFQLENHDIERDPWPWGGESVYRNGKYCGHTTSTAYGFTLEKHVCLGYVFDIDQSTKKLNYLNPDFVMSKNASFEIEIAQRRFPAKASLYPPRLPTFTAEDFMQQFKGSA